MLVSFPPAISDVSPSAVSGSVRPRPSNRLLASLSAADLALLGPFRESLLPRGMVLHEPGTTIEHVYFPLGGMISLIMRMRGGETVEIVPIGREGALGTGVALGIPRALSTAIVAVARDGRSNSRRPVPGGGKTKQRGAPDRELLQRIADFQYSAVGGLQHAA
jgi:hypothetical protein